MHLIKRGFLANPAVFAAAFLITLVAIVGAGSLLAQAPGAATADELFRAKDWTRAAAAYEAAVKGEPGNGMAWLRLGIARQSLKQFESAIAAYEQAAKHGVAVRPHYNRAAALALLGRPEEAFAALDQALAAGFPGAQMLRDDPDFASLRSDARFQQAVARADRNGRPCAYAPENRQFDFWLGDWQVDSAGQPAGSSSVQLLLEGCVLYENWSGASGYSGKSFNVFNPEKKKWQQFWVDALGQVTFFEGEVAGDRLVYMGENVANGTPTLRRMTFFKLGDGHVRQVGEDSTDGGKTWSVQYDLNYVRKQ